MIQIKHTRGYKLENIDIAKNVIKTSHLQIFRMLLPKEDTELTVRIVPSQSHQKEPNLTPAPEEENHIVGVIFTASIKGKKHQIFNVVSNTL